MTLAYQTYPFMNISIYYTKKYISLVYLTYTDLYFFTKERGAITASQARRRHIRPTHKGAEQCVPLP